MKKILMLVLLAVTGLVAVAKGPYQLCIKQPGTLSITEAREYFEKKYTPERLAYIARQQAAVAHRSLYPGEMALDWDNARYSENTYIYAVEVPMISPYRFDAVYLNTMKRVTCMQKMVITKQKEDGHLSDFFWTLIPSSDYVTRHTLPAHYSAYDVRCRFSGTRITQSLTSGKINNVTQFHEGSIESKVFTGNPNYSEEGLAAMAAHDLAGIQIQRFESRDTPTGTSFTIIIPGGTIADW